MRDNFVVVISAKAFGLLMRIPTLRLVSGLSHTH